MDVTTPRMDKPITQTTTQVRTGRAVRIARLIGLLAVANFVVSMITAAIVFFTHQ
jgi:hypothetical protein